MTIGAWKSGGSLTVTEINGDDTRTATLELSGWRVMIFGRLILTIAWMK